MQNQLNGDPLNDNKTAFIFESPDASDIIDGLLSDSNESTSSSEHNGHPLIVPHENNGHNHVIHATGEKRKYDDFIESTNGHENSMENSKKLPQNGKKTKGRVKIKMEFIDNKLRRYTTFSKRKTGIMKKAYELSTLTGTQVMLLVASETGHVYTFATRKLQPMITSEAGKALIQTCLNSPDPHLNGADQRMSATGFEETDLTYSVNEDSEKDEASSSSSCLGVQYLPSANSTNIGDGVISSSSTNTASQSTHSSTSIHNTVASQNMTITTPTYTQLQNALPVSFLQQTAAAAAAAVDTANSSKTVPSNVTGTLTTAILGGVLPSSTLIAPTSSQLQTSSTSTASSDCNQQTLYRLSDIGGTNVSAAGNRTATKVTSTPIFNAGNVVLCANSNGSSSISSMPLMYQTASGVVYATSNASMFPESLILNLGQNIEAIGTNQQSRQLSSDFLAETTFTQSANKNSTTVAKGSTSKKSRK